MLRQGCAMCKMSNWCSWPCNLTNILFKVTELKEDWVIQTQQTRDIKPMLVQCLASVVDGGSTLNQHWLVFAGESLYPSKHGTFSQWWFNVGPASQTLTQHLAAIVWMCCVCRYDGFLITARIPLQIRVKTNTDLLDHTCYNIPSPWAQKVVPASLPSERYDIFHAYVFQRIVLVRCSICSPFSAGTEFIRQIVTSVDVRLWRLNSIPALKE